MKFTLPYPPTVNLYWRRNRQGVTHLSEDARKFKTLAKLKALSQLPRDKRAPPAGAVGLEIDVYRPRRSGDLDNTLKALLDALCGIAYLDDAQVVEIHARRFDDKGNPRVEVNVTELDRSTYAVEGA